MTIKDVKSPDVAMEIYCDGCGRTMITFWYFTFYGEHTIHDIAVGGMNFCNVCKKRRGKIGEDNNE